MKSGSKKPPTAPPELHDWQREVLAALARTSLASELVFGGGAALAALYLHHRTSEDLDFFAVREVDAAELTPLAKLLARGGVTAKSEHVGPRRSLRLFRDENLFGRIDFAYYPC